MGAAGSPALRSVGPPAAALPFRPALPILLSLLAGYVDTSGYLALQGLFTAHVTGNFVTLGATLAFGTTGALAKLVALPVFCVVVAATRLAGSALSEAGRPSLIVLFGAMLGLLIAAFVLAVALGPFPNGDSWPALVTGMTLVSAMAIQNAAHRIFLSAAPSSTVMTSSTTQLMIDLADLLRGETQGRAAMTARLKRITISVGAFAAGCACAALFYARLNVWCFALPPLLAAAAIPLSRAKKAGPG